ncbi:MAG: PTS sugar transporter subunit IIA [Deltaproteobacteria bacterium]|nr:PTS sugar transporter subunit IIA [Deltaproteobacteria bacterium]
MNLILSLNADNIAALSSTTPKDAIRELVARIVKNSDNIPKDSVESLCAAVLEREASQSTGVGHGFAFPHARIDEWPHPLEIAIGISKQGLNFNSIDDGPVHVVCLMISSREEPYLILKKMSSIIHALKQLDFASTDYDVSEILALLDTHDKSEETIIYASDVMRPVACTVTMDTSIEHVAHLMHTKRLDVIPVVDSAKRFCGEVSCYDIFQFGMPEYFSKLPTISFVRHIDPFEQYFRIRGDLRVCDLTLRPAKPMSRSHTLLEVIFEMSVKKRDRLFVTNGHERLVGMIDRFCIVDKILFF